MLAPRGSGRNQFQRVLAPGREISGSPWLSSIAAIPPSARRRSTWSARSVARTNGVDLERAAAIIGREEGFWWGQNQFPIIATKIGKWG
ncbi:hypothetical protein Vau01_064490 [Virgisporangium aurantiacum]|uniref:Uncharacterized protein n=1 Tax=Virgisporangium aurantiacum TaxID=175570 RepID=A0A8J4E2I3_9ACTN|nr:hypothetical protein Vau01_064490 [Virgisporangium aurantiacum]